MPECSQANMISSWVSQFLAAWNNLQIFQKMFNMVIRVVTDINVMISSISSSTQMSNFYVILMLLVAAQSGVVCFMFLSVGWLSLMFGSKTRPLQLALLSSTHLSFLTLSSALNTVTAVTAAAGVITSIAVTRSLDDAMISCVYRRPPLMHMAIGYRCLPKIIELDF